MELGPLAVLTNGPPAEKRETLKRDGPGPPEFITSSEERVAGSTVILSSVYVLRGATI